MTRHRDVPEETPAPARGLAGMVLLMAGIGVVLYAWVGDRSQPSPTAPKASAPAPQASTTAASAVPPFHADPESAKPFPALLDPAQFEIPVVARAYAIAREMPAVLAQQPCYCNCGVFGHGSLLDCFASTHGAT